MSYRVVVRPSARKDVERLPEEARDRVRVGIRTLAEDPRGPNTKRLYGKLAGLRRLRVGDYRVIYDLDDKTHRVVILRVTIRESAY